MSRFPRFRLAETTADTGLLAWGATREELFENAAAGLLRIMADPRGVRPLEERAVRARGEDAAGLLAAWLDELVYLFDTEGFLAGAAAVRFDDGGGVTGILRGERYDPGRHRLRAYVKGVTLHRIEVRREGGRLRARVVIDR